MALVTFVTAVHAHHASVRTNVALHAFHSRLAGAQARHLLAVVAHRARGVAVARCRMERHTERNKERVSIFRLKATIGNKEHKVSWFKLCAFGSAVSHGGMVGSGWQHLGGEGGSARR